MADSEIHKKILEYKVEGRRRVGRPRLRWEDCIIKDIKKLGVRNWWTSGELPGASRSSDTRETNQTCAASLSFVFLPSFPGELSDVKVTALMDYSFAVFLGDSMSQPSTR
ncbi:hypothetical protein C0J52_06326 [Blattella germanica]|nr:hypothetical protein C0J52_06326 [Blattella germanica]